MPISWSRARTLLRHREEHGLLPMGFVNRADYSRAKLTAGGITPAEDTLIKERWATMGHNACYEEALKDLALEAGELELLNEEIDNA